MRATPAVLVIAVALTSCRSPEAPASAPTIALEVVSGDLQEGRVAEMLAEPLVVRARDGGGNLLPGEVVTFRVTEGGGEVFSGAAATDGDGIAKERWFLGTTSRDTQRVEARIVDPATGEPLVLAEFRAVGEAAEPWLVECDLPHGCGAIGSQLPDTITLRVVVLDRFGNPVPQITVKWRVTGGDGAILDSASRTRGLGRAKSTFAMGVDLGLQQARASVAGLEPVFFGDEILCPLNGVLEMVSGDEQSGTRGAPLASSLVVRLRLDHGVLLQGAPIDWWSSKPGRGSSMDPPDGITDAQGEASSTWTLANTEPASPSQVATAEWCSRVVTFTAFTGHSN